MNMKGNLKQRPREQPSKQIVNLIYTTIQEICKGKGMVSTITNTEIELVIGALLVIREALGRIDVRIE